MWSIEVLYCVKSIFYFSRVFCFAVKLWLTYSFPGQRRNSSYYLFFLKVICWGSYKSSFCVIQWMCISAVFGTTHIFSTLAVAKHFFLLACENFFKKHFNMAHLLYLTAYVQKYPSFHCKADFNWQSVVKPSYKSVATWKK